MKADPELLETLLTPVVQCLKNRTPPWLVSKDAETPWRHLDLPLKDHGRPFEGINQLVLWASSQQGGFRSPYWFTKLQAEKSKGCCDESQGGTSLILFGAGKQEATLYTVYNAEQIQGLSGRFQADSLTYSRPSPNQTSRAEEFITGLRLTTVEGSGDARYIPGSEIFSIPRVIGSVDPVDRLSMWMQLIPHWIGEKEPKLGWATYRQDDPKYVLSELAASIAGGLLCSHFGIPCRLRPEHLKYLPHWENFISRDPATFRYLLKSAQACAQKLTDSPV